MSEYVSIDPKQRIARAIAKKEMQPLKDAHAAALAEIARKEIKLYLKSLGFSSMEELAKHVPEPFRRSRKEFRVRYEHKENRSYFYLDFTCEDWVVTPNTSGAAYTTRCAELHAKEYDELCAIDEQDSSMRRKERDIKETVLGQIRLCKSRAAIEKKLPDYLDIIKDVLGEKTEHPPALLPKTLRAQIDGIITRKP